MRRKANRPAAVPLDPAQLEAVARLFAVLSEPTRLRIVQRLHAAPATVGDVVADLGLKQANASKQLGLLFDAGVVGRRRLGTRVEYSVGMPLVVELCDLVCGGLRDAAVARASSLGALPPGGGPAK